MEELFGNKFSLLLWAGAVLCFVGFGLQQASKTTATTANKMVQSYHRSKSSVCVVLVTKLILA